MKRREFITLIGGAAASWPLAARAQQGGGAGSRVGWRLASRVGAVCIRVVRGLKEIGYVDGGNVRIEYRWAEGRYFVCRNWWPNWSASKSGLFLRVPALRLHLQLKRRPRRSPSSL